MIDWKKICIAMFIIAHTPMAILSVAIWFMDCSITTKICIDLVLAALAMLSIPKTVHIYNHL